jgi:predicted DCC family thiol-disulfide oxidoreductase YuxK
VRGDRSARYVVLYDGDCGFCTRWRDRLSPRDRDGRVEWLSVHDPSVSSRFPDLDRDDAMRQMYVFAPDGKLHKGSEGWRELFEVLHGLSWLAALYRIPGVPFLIRHLYRFIARRRYSLSCSGAGCRLPILVALMAVLAVVSWACAGAPPDQVTELLQGIADSHATEVVAAALKAYGGYPTWTSHRNVEYTHTLTYHGGEETPQVVSRQIHRFGLGPEVKAYVEDLEGPAPQIVRLDGEAVGVTRGGVSVTDPDELGFPKAFGRIARWTFLAPWSLLDSGSRLQSRAERTPPAAGRVPPGVCDVVRLTFDAKDRGGPSDWHDFYFSRVSHLIDRVHSYRAEDGAYFVTIWSDHRGFDGIRVATRRETHRSDETGLIGPLEVVVEYADVRFDAPFGDDMFETPAPRTSAEPLEASAGRE